MGLYENIRDIAKSKGYSVNRLEQELGFARSSINKFNKNTPSAEKIQQIADFLEVSLDFLMTGESSEKNKNDDLTARDRRDIGKDLDRIMEEIANDEDGPLFYNGEPLKNEDLTFLSRAIEAALTDAKKRNKVTYNPNKNKKQ